MSCFNKIIPNDPIKNYKYKTMFMLINIYLFKGLYKRQIQPQTRSPLVFILI